MSSPILSIQVPLGRFSTDFGRILRWRLPNVPTMRSSGSIPCRLKCSASLANSAVPTRTAKELEDTYGCQGLSFFEAGGITAADLKLENGCKARLVLSTAQITSYKAHMWHRGEEELLHTVNSGSGKPASDSLFGGINLHLFQGHDPLSSILLPSTSSWSVEDVNCKYSSYAQITLTRSSNFEVGMPDVIAGCVQVQYVVTLTESSLSSAVLVKNVGLPVVEFTGSIVSHLEVSSLEGTFALGLNGYRHLSLSSIPTEQIHDLFESRNFFSSICDSKTERRGLGLLATATSPSGRNNSVTEFEGGLWKVEKEDYSQLREGEGRYYPSPPESVTLLDRGFRRSLIIQRLGFQELWISNPGPGKRRDWDDFICLGPTQLAQSVVLHENDEWRAAQILINPGRGKVNDNVDVEGPADFVL